jgi:hypothetical protein
MCVWHVVLVQRFLAFEEDQKGASKTVFTTRYHDARGEDRKSGAFP